MKYKSFEMFFNILLSFSDINCVIFDKGCNYPESMSVKIKIKNET